MAAPRELKTVLITGGTDGLGRATALVLAERVLCPPEGGRYKLIRGAFDSRIRLTLRLEAYKQLGKYPPCKLAEPTKVGRRSVNMSKPLLNRTHAAVYVLLAFFGAGLLALTAHTQTKQKKPIPPVPILLKIMWIDHLDFLPGDPSVTTSFNAVSSGVGGGLSGLIIQSNTLGNTATGGGNKVVEKGLQVPPGYLIKGVRICYELSNARTFFTQTRLDQVKDPPSQSIVLLDDATHLTNPGPVCVDSQSTTVDPSRGAVRLSFRINTGDTLDRIVLRAVGLHLQPHP